LEKVKRNNVGVEGHLSVVGHTALEVTGAQSVVIGTRAVRRGQTFALTARDCCRARDGI
jgi:hypothetical protein